MQEDIHINYVVFISAKNDLPKLMKQSVKSLVWLVWTQAKSHCH